MYINIHTVKIKRRPEIIIIFIALTLRINKFIVINKKY